MKEIIAAKSEYEQLKAKLRDLRAEVSALTARRDELTLRECPRIKAEYDARIGALELRVFDARNRLYELKRAIEILQAARNRREQKSGDEAAEQAHKEYEAYEEDLKRKAEDIKNSRAFQESEEEKERRWQEEQRETAETTSAGDHASGNGSAGDDAAAGTAGADSDKSKQKSIGENTGAGEGTSKQEREKAGGTDEAGENGKKFKSRAEELRYYYCLLVKRLHPDANPNQTEEEAELLRQTMEAYKNGDLDKLKEIYQTLKGSRPEEAFRDTPEDIAEMKRIIANLEEKKAALQKEIRQIEQSYPYKWKVFLENEEAVAAMQKNLANQLSQYEKQYQELLMRFEDLKNGKEPA